MSRAPAHVSSNRSAGELKRERRGEGMKDALAAPYLFGDLGERDRETGTAIDSRNGTVRPRLLVVSWALKQKRPAISGRSFGSA